MRLNDYMSIRTWLHTTEQDWVSSPSRGVERRMLFRIGEEKARATSLVRYAPGSRFSYHVHPGGEEFLVLDGIFQDETGDFPAGSYVRNPPGTGHAPGSETGCTIFVKLWQFSADDCTRIVRRPGEGELVPSPPGVSSSCVLFRGAGELVMLEEWQANANIALPSPDGLELLVLSGEIMTGGERLVCRSWLRLPSGTTLTALTGAEGARVWFKSAPLLHHNVCAFGRECSTDKVADDGNE